MSRRGKELCHGEPGYFDTTEFEVVDGTKIHLVDPPHRAMDGVIVTVVNGKLVETQTGPPPTSFIIR